LEKIRNHHVLLRQIDVIQHKSPTHSWQNKMVAKIQKKSPCRAGKTIKRLVSQQHHNTQLAKQDGGLFLAETTVRNWQHKMAAGL
jgi:hypothetical protein